MAQVETSRMIFGFLFPDNQLSKNCVAFPLVLFLRWLSKPKEVGCCHNPVQGPCVWEVLDVHF